MKYGIQILNKETGVIEYAASAKGGYISATSDISNIALFAQEASAITAVKAARKYGHEKEGTVLQVVGILPVVQSVTDVAYPPKKSGYIMTHIDAKGKEVYFVAPARVGSSYYGAPWANVEAATVFRTELDAQARLAEYKEIADRQLQGAIADLEDIKRKLEWQTKYRSNGHETINQYSVDAKAQWVVSYQGKRDLLDTVEIKYV